MNQIPTQVSESVRRKNPHLYGPAPVYDNTYERSKPAKRIRQSSKPLMNKLEEQWFEVLKRRFGIVLPQSIRFMLGRGVWYKPDFVCWPVGFDSQDPRMRVWECKGPHAFRGGFENLKVAAHKYPHIQWNLVWKNEVGQWCEQTVLP